MEKQKVAFLGPVASYTHQAALENFPLGSYELVPQITIADVFHAVQSGAVQRGVVPFENSTNGTVTMTLDLFADRQRELPDILVCGEAYVDVRHCLVGRLTQQERNAQAQVLSQTPQSPQAQSGGQFEEIRPVLQRIHRLYSHPQAWGQCERFLSSYLRGVERQDVSSTSKAADIVARENPREASHPMGGGTTASAGESAAISSETAARLYGLDILAAGMQDEASNMTRFFVICKEPSEDNATSPTSARTGTARADSYPLATDPAHPIITSTTMDAAAGGYAMGNPFSSPTFKTLVSFTIPHTSPGALAKSLAVFADHGMNLTSINTRPSLTEPWNYLFFVEMLGRRENNGRGAVNAALRDLSGVARGWRWLGSWEMQVDTAMD